ncbi:unnamed protein product [Schistosoma curassoni]|uniref:TPX2_importin domain-containing protein n=1 Tax=Schistosoma curassoni TaxID=6186 RepID=A0A183JWJ8_9TREM|nr:unnamed protein product [Schistosoma curassoni]
MSSKKPPKALYVPPALRANKNASEVKKELSFLESPISYASVNEQTDVEQQLKSLTLSDNCTDDDECVLKKKLFNQKLSHNDSNSEPARKINDASLASKLKIARSPGDWTMPYKKRPVTTSSTARRLISNHLGIVPTKIKSPEETMKEEQDKALLREARGKLYKCFPYCFFCLLFMTPLVFRTLSNDVLNLVLHFTTRAEAIRQAQKSLWEDE